MSDFLPPVINKVGRKLRGLGLRSQLQKYLASMSKSNPLHGLPFRIVGDAYADPTEFFTHYDAFAYWVSNKLIASGVHHKILDVGSPKMQNAIFSASHDVTSVVLSDCSDSLSAVCYVQHDVSDPLPFPDDSFDRLISTVALPLIGLGRYGDKVNPDCLHDFVRELDRVMTDGASLYVSMCLGPNFLAYNNGWYLDLETTKRVFSVGGWELADAVVDNMLSPSDLKNRTLMERFTSPDNAMEIPKGQFRVVFCEFYRSGFDQQYQHDSEEASS